VLPASAVIELAAVSVFAINLGLTFATGQPDRPVVVLRRNGR
jgi:anti-sigma-K factor RskA